MLQLIWGAHHHRQKLTMSLRVVSLLPSATDTVVALGLAPLLVGRSHEVNLP